MRSTSVPCRDDRERRSALRAGDLNGLDYVEVDDDDRHRLTVTFINKLGALAQTLTEANFVISGGRRVHDIRVTRVEVCEPDDPEVDDCLTLTVDHIGDVSCYTLCVVDAENGRPTERLHAGFDPVYACLAFSFQAQCPSPLDCAAETPCPSPQRETPPLDYLAKDYASFRQLMLDQLSITLPKWGERHEPDLMIALVELLAYEGDRLSYLQDAVGTEAYLHTARQRISVRRHTRLVDYHLHEGCNARAFVTVETFQDTPPISLDDFFFVTAFPGAPPHGGAIGLEDLVKVPTGSYEVFEPIAEATDEEWTSRRLLDPAGFCRKLLEADDPVYVLIRHRLHPDLLAALQSWGGTSAPPDDLVDAVLQDIGRIAATQTLQDDKAFASHCRAPGPRRVLDHPLHCRNHQRINRVLIEQALKGDLIPPGQIRFYYHHSRIRFYMWGERDCCLPAGTTAATLLDMDPESEGYRKNGEDAAEAYHAPMEPEMPERVLHLRAGEFLILEEVISPTTGLPEDADPSHRHAVRLTKVRRSVDPLRHVPILEIEWAPEDALPFPLCLSAIGPPPACEWIADISVARGNVLLADHGKRETEELDAVEVEAIHEPCDECGPEQELVARRYRPVLRRPDLTFSEPLVRAAPASLVRIQDPYKALPQITLSQIPLAPPRLDLPDPLERYRNPLPLTTFEPEDLVAPVPLLLRLKRATGSTDPLGAYLRGRLDEQTLQALADFEEGAEPSDVLLAGLLAGLRSALDDAGLYDPARFPDISLDAPTKSLLDDRPLPTDLERLLGRWMLEQTLDGAVAPTQRFVAEWSARSDLLASSGDDHHFVVEMSDDRRAFLRFGDDDLGERPDAMTRFRARFRVGSGRVGNVGADTITLLVVRKGPPGMTLRPRNPLAAFGGTDPETLDEVRQRAPYAIRHKLARAITAEDYAALARRDRSARIQGAAAELIWTGSWYEAHVTLDPLGSDEAPETLLNDVARDLERYRRVGHDLHVARGRPVPLAIVVQVCVKPGYQKAHVLAALEDAFRAGPKADGSPGFFDPDALTFGRSVDVSKIVAAAQAVPGVLWSKVTSLTRLGEPEAGELESGTLPLEPTEIARVGSLRYGFRFPEDGSITFDLEGGR